MAWTCDDIPDLSRRTAVVTGANGGLGLETSRALARAGAHVVMAARNQEKAAMAEDDILCDAPGASLEVVALDLGSQDSVRAAAERILAMHPAIDILDRKSTRLNSSHTVISYAVFCLKKKKIIEFTR